MNTNTTENKKVVFFPSCGCRMLDGDKESESLSARIHSILSAIGYEIIYPQFKNECCGLMYRSEGTPDLAETKRKSLFMQLKEASINGELPIITENASCALELKEENFDLKVQDAIYFIANALKDYPLKLVNKTIMLHVNCSISRLKERNVIIALARRCATEVVTPPDIYCCGFAGSKGFTTPKLNRNALKTLKSQIPKNCHEGYTCLQTCEIGLSKHSGIPYNSLLDLVTESLCI